MVENSLTTRAQAGLLAGQERGGYAGLSPGRRVYVVGDVHGYRDKLDAVHALIRADLQRRPVARPLLVHLGDLIDRGPDSAGCVGLLAGGPPIRGVPTVNLMGNHESMMLGALAGGYEEVERWLDNGGEESLRSWGLRPGARPRDWLAGLPPRHLVFLRDLVTCHELEGYLFVHAGVRPGVPLMEQRETDMLWIREAFLEWDGVMLPEAPNRVVVHGHTPAVVPVFKQNRIGLDTGSGKGGSLTCGVLEEDSAGFFAAG